MNEETWLIGVMLFALMQAISFFEIAYKARVLSVFGKKSLPYSSLVYLSFIAIMPALALFISFFGPFAIESLDDKMVNASVLSAMHVGNYTAMGWLSLGIRHT